MESLTNWVTITAKRPLFKKGTGEPATSIEVLNFAFRDGDECGFNVVSQKDLFSMGDTALYIQPDSCLSNHEIFSSFIAPNGDPNKSKLGKNNRVRAIKFNFNLENSSDPVYSNGILLPSEEVENARPRDYPGEGLMWGVTDFLGITKYEEPERFGTGNAKGSLPGFLYKTDEENAANLKSHINRVLEAGERIGWTLKIDGSSFTQYFKKGQEGWTTGICSRTLEKKLPEDLSLTSDPWIHLSISSGLFERGMQYCIDNDRELVFRGEIYGEGLKGSGNKLNPHSKEKPNLVIFGIDTLESGFAVKLLPKEVAEICEACNIEYLPTEEILEVNSYQRLMDRAKNLFSYYQESKNQTIEGIVVRTLKSNRLSTKIMNDLYDSKK